MVLTYALASLLAGALGARAQTEPRPRQDDPAANFLPRAGGASGLNEPRPRQDGPPAPEDAAPVPGLNVAAFVPASDHIMVQGYGLDQQLQLIQSFSYNQPPDTDQIAAAAGYVLRPDGEQVVYARRYNGESVLRVAFVANPPSNEPSYVFDDLAPRLLNSADFMDVAAGDLDDVADGAGHKHDEVVVAYASSPSDKWQIKVAVLDYTNPAGTAPAPDAVTTATASTFIDAVDFVATQTTGTLPVDNALGVAVGDFDGDGRKEIAVAHLQDHQKMWVSMFRYTNNGQGNRSLVEVSSASQDAAALWAGTVDVAAGDFDGKGADELLVAGSQWKPGGDNFDQSLDFSVWQADGSLSMTRKAVLGDFGNSTRPFSNSDLWMRVQVTPGLFKYDPANGFGVNRRQFAAAWNDNLGVTTLTTFQVSDDLGTISQINEGSGFPRFTPDLGVGGKRFSIAAVEGSTTASPVSPWGIAISNWSSTGAYWLAVSDGNGFQTPVNPSTTTDDPAGRFPVVAFGTCPAITLAPSELPGGQVGAPYDQTFSATPGGTGYTFAVTQGALPTGLTLNPTTGVLSGTPTQAGTSSFRVTATGAGGCAGSRDYKVAIECPTITLAPSELPGGQVGVAYSQTVSAAPGGTGYAFAVTQGTLPAGLQLNPTTGVLSGTPTQAGTSNFRVTATGAGGCTGARDYTVAIGCPAITLAPETLPGGQLDAPYDQQLSAAPGGTSYTFAVIEGALPIGLALDPTTGAINGTPIQVGTSSFRVTATSAGGCTGLRGYTVTIACPTITLAPDTLPGGQVGTPYNQTVSAAPGGTGYTFAVTEGTLPAGLTLDPSTGQISGTPTASGSYSFRVTATGFGACAGSRDYTITVACPAITVAPSELPGGQVGAPYSQQLVATPRGRSYAFAVTEGTLPAGLQLDPTTGVLSGTPTQAGTSSFRVAATGAGGCAGSRDYTVTIACPTITLAPDTLPAGGVGTPYSQQLSATPGGTTYTFAVTEGTLPAGLTLDPSTGQLSGTPTASGNYSFRVTATGFGACSGARDYTVAISNRLTVTNTNDSGSGSLRQTIADAAPGDTVDFAPSVRGTVTLTSGQLHISKSLTIEGPGASRLSVSGNNRSRVFLVDNVSTVTISGLTVTDGNAAGGGGLQVTDFSTLTLNDCTISNNSAAVGGGIESVQSVLTVNDCAVVNNQSVNAGAGIYIDAAGSTAVINSTVSGNRAGPQGGGGIAMNSAGATLTITNATVVNNSTAGSGGGVSVQAGTLDLKNTVVARNLTDGGIDGSFNDQGGNLIGGDPLLAPLAFYGGQTPTHAPLPGSPAIDAGTNDGAPPTDQRGEPRPVGARVDSGSFESRLFLVTNTNDDGAGSLRQAIADNNASDTVAGGQVFFRLPGAGPHAIAPASVLPPIIKPVTIDGLTQPGASCAAWPPTLLVELDGTNAGAGSGLLFYAGGSGSVVRGLVINRFGADGVSIESADNRLECNFIGTDVAGTEARGNGRNGVTIDGAGNVVGGLSAERRNLISANATHGVQFSFPTTNENQVVGNYIGTDASGAAPLGNGDSGVLVNSGATDNTIGGTNPGAANRIAFNRGAGGAGVAVLQDTGGGNRILGNAIYANANLGIALAAGANNGQTSPALTSVAGGQIIGTLASTPSSAFRVEFFANAECDPSGRAQGETFLGFQDVLTDASGNASFTFTPDDTRPAITATATNIATGDTSEFSACRSGLVPPTVTGETLSIAQATTSDGVKIATVAAPGRPLDTLAFTVTPASGSGVTVSNTSINADGEMRATLAASCTATASTFEVRVTDNRGASGTGTLTVNVTPQTTPPVIEACAADRTLTADNTGQAVLPDLTGEVRASDDCTPAPLPVTQTPAPGTPLGIGTTTVTFTVKDGAGNEASCGAQVTVVAPCPAVAVGPLALPGGQVAVPYNQAVFATPGDRSYTFAVTLGELPPGLQLGPSSNPSIALLTGTPTQAGTSSFRITATTAEGCTSYHDYTVTISGCPVITLAPETLPGGQVGTAYSQTVSAAPGGAGYTFAVTAGALPPGLGLNAATGEISGTPTQAANVAFTVTATDANGCSGSRDYVLAISGGCPVIALGALPDGTFGVPYNAAIGVTPAGNYRFAVTAGSLPPGLQLNAATGRVRGTPLDAGRAEFTITATNTRTNCQGARAYGVTINDLGSR